MYQTWDTCFQGCSRHLVAHVFSVVHLAAPVSSHPATAQLYPMDRGSCMSCGLFNNSITCLVLCDRSQQDFKEAARLSAEAKALAVEGMMCLL